MKLKNKKTGKVLAVESISLLVPTLVADKKTIQLTGTDIETGYREMYRYKNVAELNEEWEDVPEEPKPQVVYYIDRDGEIVPYKNIEYPKRVFNTEQNKAIGNYFETKEEAKLAVRKLKAWKRLKDKGFRFCGHDDRDRGQLGDIVIYAEMPTFEYDDDSTRDDLDLLFCTEENS